MSLIGVESPSASPIFVSSVGALILFCLLVGLVLLVACWFRENKM